MLHLCRCIYLCVLHTLTSDHDFIEIGSLLESICLHFYFTSAHFEKTNESSPVKVGEKCESRKLDFSFRSNFHLQFFSPSLATSVFLFFCKKERGSTTLFKWDFLWRSLFHNLIHELPQRAFSFFVLFSLSDHLQWGDARIGLTVARLWPVGARGGLGTRHERVARPWQQHSVRSTVGTTVGNLDHPWGWRSLNGSGHQVAKWPGVAAVT